LQTTIAPAASQRVVDADRGGDRAGEHQADGSQHEGAERVVRADAGLCALGHLALEDREPQRQVDGEADVRQERRGAEHPDRRAESERDELEHERQRRDDARDERPLRAVAKRDHTARKRAEAADCEDRRPGTRAAELVLGDNGPEHHPEHEEEVPEPEDEHRRPEPGARGELLPALAQLAEEAWRLVARQHEPGL
jgi:hypothetical protein